MKDVNKILLIGRLGKDPAQKATKTGAVLVQFPLATSRRVREAGEAKPEGSAEFKEETQWHQVYVWGREGEVCMERLKKGHLVFVEGSVRMRRYKTQEGDPRVAFEVHADSVSFLSRPAARGEDGARVEAAEPVTEALSA